VHFKMASPSRKFFTVHLLLFTVYLLFGCAPLLEKPVAVPEKPPAVKPVPRPPATAPQALAPVPSREIPTLTDDLDPVSLEQSVARSLQYLERFPAKRTYRFGDRRCTVQDMKDSLVFFLSIMRGADPPEVKEKRIRESFDFYRAAGQRKGGKVLFTGYYEPVLEGSFEETEIFRHPVYELPSDMVTVHLGKFRSKFKGERIVGRVAGGELVPYYNRRDIDAEGALENKGHEIAWLSDPVDVFFLHIQGSGMIRFPGGGFMQISFAGSNGRPYRGLGRMLFDSGKITEKEMSLRGIKKYLRGHPEEMTDIMSHNESYVFFRMVEEGPVGAIGVPLTGGRSIATDLDLFPRGALAFIRLRKPLFDGEGEIASWTAFSRFVLNQDTGGVIKGPARVDLFCGRGREAELTAGTLNEEGELFFLLKKKGDKALP
jgi:membrane-bound lytic murein transglycosylase A